ncbi:hypothetical protein Enr8_13040 [Blastopirellula retiformator]|uniref:Glycosyltransferase RgtA/B/C/D-like domain-containing protein n=2 Tax=Blastopirellula retiformator TaxID=2527970 RepID=A0A5C5VLU6_9BACT|nr:hypothetical protein Enr8_13040 [Blastopirellula retiformator]
MESANDKTNDASPRDTTPLLSDRYALSPLDFAIVSFFVVAFLLFYYLPLSTVGVWRDISVGRTILAESQLPSHPVQMPLAATSLYRPTNWLADISLALVNRAGGPEAISLASTLVATGYLLFVYFVLCPSSSPKWLRLIAVALAAATLLFCWQGLTPELASSVRLALFLTPLAIFAGWRQSNMAPSIWSWIVAPLAIVAWANTHWTFVAGPLLMSAIAVGVACDSRLTGRSWGETCGDRQVQAWVWLAQLCWFVTLLNPFGFGVWAEALAQIVHPLDGSTPLVLASGLGAIVALLVAALACLLRRSQTPVHGGDIAMFVVAISLAACNTHFVLTLVAVATMICLPMTAGLFARSDKAEPVATSDTQEPRPLRFAFTLLSLLAIWIGFALSPISASVLGGTPRMLASAIEDPPLGVVRFLHENRRERFILAPVVWSDFIAYADADAEMFATSDFDRLPQQAKFDFRRLYQGGSQWQRILDRYDVDTLVIDKRAHGDFATQVLGDVGGDWQLAWENARALVLQRRSAA